MIELYKNQTAMAGILGISTSRLKALCSAGAIAKPKKDNGSVMYNVYETVKSYSKYLGERHGGEFVDRFIKSLNGGGSGWLVSHDQCHKLDMQDLSKALTNKYMLTEEQIVNHLASHQVHSGVYFLIKNDRVVYVGQSVNVHSRVTSHRDKEFDRYSYILVPRDRLDEYESLYIHFLNPPLNGKSAGGFPCSPLRLDELFGLTKNKLTGETQ